MEIPLDDSTALSYLAEFHDEIDEAERSEIMSKLSPEGQAVARAIFSKPDPADPPDAQRVAQTLIEWARGAAGCR
jgi:uncharacterized membrane protein YebE (DUF533 family)